MLRKLLARLSLIDARLVQRKMRWTLFIVLLWTWPLPFFGLDGALIPTVRFIQLAVSLSILIVLEGAGGMVGAFFVLLWGHVLVYGLILFGVASIFESRFLSRLPDRVGVWVGVAAVVALVFWASFTSPYDTMFHHSNAHASLLELYR